MTQKIKVTKQPSISELQVVMDYLVTEYYFEMNIASEESEDPVEALASAHGNYASGMGKAINLLKPIVSDESGIEDSK